MNVLTEVADEDFPQIFIGIPFGAVLPFVSASIQGILGYEGGIPTRFRIRWFYFLMVFKHGMWFLKGYKGVETSGETTESLVKN